MRTVLVLMLSVCCAAAGAQEAGDEQPAAGADAGGPAENCLPVEDSPQATAGDSGPLKAPEVDGSVEGPCEETASSEAPDQPIEGPAASVEEDPAIEASAQEVFKPGDEIPEDYPVPLPSDI